MWKLGRPKSFVFDEVYYVDGARDLLKYGVEVTGSAPEFIVHPPVGKWFIGLGIKIFGDNSFGWRFAVAIIGALTIILVARIALHLFNSRYMSTLAAGLRLGLQDQGQEMPHILQGRQLVLGYRWVVCALLVQSYQPLAYVLCQLGNLPKQLLRR